MGLFQQLKDWNEENLKMEQEQEATQQAQREATFKQALGKQNTPLVPVETEEQITPLPNDETSRSQLPKDDTHNKFREKDERMRFCPKCGLQNPAESRFCASCGTPITLADGDGNIEDKKNGNAIISFVLGIIGIIAWLVPLFGAPIAVLGLILGIIGRKSEKKVMVTVGIVLSSISLLLSIINTFLGAVIWSAFLLG